MYQLDHLVVLLPYAYIAEKPPVWLSSNFTIVPGGRHGDGKTENKLIVLADGSYIELIAFIDDSSERRAGHYWDKPYGAVDFALTSSGSGQANASEAETVHRGIAGRLATLDASDSSRFPEGASGPGPRRPSYTDPIPGGRTNKDGEEITWRVTFPKGIDRGEIPFFCHDLTPRERRVPMREPNVNHPCGAVGVAQIRIVVPQGRLQASFSLYEAVLGLKAQQSSSSIGEHSMSFLIGSVKAVGTRGPDLHLVEAATEEDRKATAGGSAILDKIVLGVQKGYQKPLVHEVIGDGRVKVSFEELLPP